MTEHMFVLGHIGPGPTFWSPWSCICGAGGTGADDAAAENQYDLHIAGFWPAYVDAIPTYREIKWKGRSLWVKP